jgi:N-acetylglutamate synthase-like GNAT family acetyltransferase
MMIRLAVPGDASAIAAVLHQAFLEYEAHYTPGGFAATTPTSDRIESRWSEGPVWVAIEDGEVVGTVGVVPKRESLYVRSMAVRPSARGHKIGETLLELIEDYAHERGHKRLYLSTTPFLDRAIRLYERFGFERIDEGPHDLFGTPLFTMAKTLQHTIRSR